MTRRDHNRQVSVMIGGVKAFNDWGIHPLASYDGAGRPEEPYWYVLPDGTNITGLIRDNGGSKRLLRTFSHDNGRTWSPIVKTDFPDATSKFFVLRTSRGYYVLVSNANPRRRDPLTLAVSEDGLVYTKLFRLIGGRHIDYPHIIEHEGYLLIAFSGAKQSMEVLKVSLDALESLQMPGDVATLEEMDGKVLMASGDGPWIDLGDEDRVMEVTAEVTVPKRGNTARFSLSTLAGEPRVTIGIDARGRPTARLYRREVVGRTLPAGEKRSMRLRLVSHRARPDELLLWIGPEGAVPGSVDSDDGWTLVNREGSSNADLARLVADGDGFDGFDVTASKAD